MKVNVSLKRPDVYVGDIIQFDKKPCMVVLLEMHPGNYGVISLDGVEGGKLLATFEGLSNIDKDSRTGCVLISKSNVVISRKEVAEECPF